MDLTKSQWKEKLSTDEDALIIDVRTQAEVNEGYIPNMMHLDIYAILSTVDRVYGAGRLAQFLELWDLKRPIILWGGLSIGTEIKQCNRTYLFNENDLFFIFSGLPYTVVSFIRRLTVYRQS